jgi:DNA polymerase-1
MRTGQVTTIMGRVRHIDGAQDRNRARQSAALRQAFNTVVQGSAADLIKSAMVRIHRAIEAQQHPWRMLIQVHDELVFETPEGKVEECAKFVKQEMGAAMELKVPLVVDLGTGENWLDAK